VAVLLLLLAVLALKKRPAALVFFAAVTTAVVAFSAYRYFGYVRHHGAIFVALVAALWMRRARGTRLMRAATTGFFGLHAVVGVFVSVVDVERPFSETHHAADFIVRSGLREMPMIGDYDLTASEVGAYLDRPIYYPASGEAGTFPRWTYTRIRSVPVEKLLDDAFARAVDGDALLVLNYRLPVASPRIERLASFEGATLADDYVYLYVVRRLQ
jgi:hypothetical protein